MGAVTGDPVSDTVLWAEWRVWMTVGAVIVLVLMSLLVVILRSARQIYADAVRALTAIQAIRTQTQDVWTLGRTNDAMRDVLETLQGIERQSRVLADARARGRR
jgi:hypothetical protein